MMLSYLEQSALYNAINFSLEGRGSDYASAANATAYNAKIALFLCPSDPNGGRVNDNCYYGSVGPTTNAGSDTPPRPTSPTCPNYTSDTSGVFAFRMALGIRDITDGASNTIAMSEGQAGASQQTVAPGNMIMGAGLSGSAYFYSAFQKSATGTTGASVEWVPRCLTPSSHRAAPSIAGPLAEPTAGAVATARAWTTPMLRATTRAASTG
jgi:hypothetical protein